MVTVYWKFSTSLTDKQTPSPDALVERKQNIPREPLPGSPANQNSNSRGKAWESRVCHAPDWLRR